MVETPLAFDFNKTRTVCDAFDDAWACLQGVGSDLTEPSKSLASRTILAKRIIEMADQGLMDVTELRDDGISACLLTRAFDRREAEAAGIGMAPLRHRRANLVL